MEFYGIITHRVIGILSGMWPVIRQVLLAFFTLSILIGLIAWVVFEDRKIMSYSLVVYLLILLLDSLLS